MPDLTDINTVPDAFDDRGLPVIHLADLDPDSISFAKALRLIRRTATGTADIPPSRLD